MSNITTPKSYTPSGGPTEWFEVDNASNPYEIGSVMSLSSGKAIPAAADAVGVGLVVEHKLIGAVAYVKLDLGGAIARNCVYSTAVAGVTIKWADNQTVAAAGNDVAKIGGRTIRVVSTNVADVMLIPFGSGQGED